MPRHHQRLHPDRAKLRAEHRAPPACQPEHAIGHRKPHKRHRQRMAPIISDSQQPRDSDPDAGNAQINQPRSQKPAEPQGKPRAKRHVAHRNQIKHRDQHADQSDHTGLGHQAFSPG